LAEGKDFARFLGAGHAPSGPESGGDRTQSEREQNTRGEGMRAGRKHESVIIRGGVPGGNWTKSLETVGKRGWAY
jgi:hypothetical protein